MPVVFLFFYLHYFIRSQTQPCIPRYGFLIVPILNLQKDQHGLGTRPNLGERVTETTRLGTMVEKMTSCGEVALKALNHIAMQPPQGWGGVGGGYPADVFQSYGLRLLEPHAANRAAALTAAASNQIRPQRRGQTDRTARTYTG